MVIDGHCSILTSIDYPCFAALSSSASGFISSWHERGYPHPPVFLPKSAEAIENKRVEFFVGAKKCKRVRKNLKRKGIGDRK
jgi:hypothetical protein